MALHVEMNIVFYPLETIEDRMKPKPAQGEVEKKVELTPEQKAAFRTQRSEVHLIKIGPITEEFLSLKKLNPALDFLEGVKFTLTEDNDYLWTSGEEMKGLPSYSPYQLLAALQRMGYTDHDNSNQIPYPFDQQQQQNSPLTKHIYVLTKKY